LLRSVQGPDSQCYATRNDTKCVFFVIASDSKNRAAISKGYSGNFSIAPRTFILVFWFLSVGLVKGA